MTGPRSLRLSSRSSRRPAAGEAAAPRQPTPTTTTATSSPPAPPPTPGTTATASSRSGNGLATSSYSYDHADNRVMTSDGGVTTYLPNQYFSATATSTTKHLFALGLPIATIDWTAGSSGTSSATIALDATTTNITNGYAGGPVTKTWSHTTSGTNRLLVLSAHIWQDVAGTGTVTSASYGGQALTKATSTRMVGIAEEVWYLVNPPTGSNTVSVTVTGATDAIKLGVSTWTGVDQSTPIPVKTGALGVSGNPSVSLTTTSTNNVVLASLDRFSTTNATTNRTPAYQRHSPAQSLQLRATSKPQPQAPTPTPTPAVPAKTGRCLRLR